MQDVVLKYKELIVITLITVLSLGLAVIMGKGGFAISAGLSAFFIGLIILIISLISLKVGGIIIIILGFTLGWVRKYLPIDIPVGLALDAVCFVLLLYILLRMKSERQFGFPNNALTWVWLAFVVYNFIQIANPFTFSRALWFNGFRTALFPFMSYILFYNIVDSKKTVKLFIRVWLILACLAAVYGLYQEFFGFLDYEVSWLYRHPEVATRIFTFGRWRRFSFLASPMSFGIIMAYSSLLCMVLLAGPFKSKSKIILGVLIVLMVYAMSFTGTRTAYALIPIGLVFYAILTFRKPVVIGVAMMLIAGVIFIVMPPLNAQHYIIQTAFRGDDKSYDVRAQNQKFIQPFIQSHPIGSGLGSTMDASGHPLLAGFPPDSQFVLVTLDTGWIGLLIYLTIFFLSLKIGVEAYFRSDDPEMKILLAALLTTIFTIMVGNYPQEVMLMETMTYWAISVGMVIKMTTIINNKIKQNTATE
ncbi:O-antigen ligase family protein [Marinigracilibium pacificum]|uniref:O-antigen ligase family protein n=1 Tax=Marinigracilibium pacificum TaxID=2729599 RepID=A0A848J211_9BACT|nr:O-antigen ligase family protein [Marinigracilibium pacificum]NMM47232.1 O-antigen ligase family protein [Marinigracilibium pacificum]